MLSHYAARCRATGGPLQRFPAGFSARNFPARLYTAVLARRCCQIMDKIWPGDNRLRNCNLILSVRSFFLILSSDAFIISNGQRLEKFSSWTKKYLPVQVLRQIHAKVCVYVNYVCRKFAGPPISDESGSKSDFRENFIVMLRLFHNNHVVGHLAATLQ